MPDNSERPLTAVALVCSLKRSPTQSSSDLMAEHVCEQLRSHGVKTDTLRCADYAIAPGVEADMGDGDEWPKIRDRVLGADILLVSTPVWLGHPSSITQRVLERLDAELSNTDDDGRPIMYGKVAVISVVGNEDGAHKVFADCAQGLNDIGFSFAAQANHVLERRSDAHHQLRRSRRGTRAGGEDDGFRRTQRRTPRSLLRAQQYPPQQWQ